MAVLLVTLVPGEPVRLDDDCPVCGWMDLWRIAVHSLTPNGVGTVADVTHCARCGHRVTAKRR